jgi:hypothetical protein
MSMGRPVASATAVKWASRLVVVRGDDEDAVHSGSLGRAGQLDRVRGDVGADPGDHLGTRAHRLEHHP